MRQKFKLFIVKKEPYLTVDENVNIGDLAIVTVGDQYPTLVECKNEDQINLIQNPKLSLTKRHKVVMKPNEMDLDETFDKFLEGDDGMIIVEVDNGNFKILNEEV